MAQKIFSMQFLCHQNLYMGEASVESDEKRRQLEKQLNRRIEINAELKRLRKGLGGALADEPR